jgi:hypothetical protein
MQINLKARNATGLEFFAKITLTADLIAEIHKLSSPDSDGDSPFVESYQNHRAWVWVYKADEKTFQADIVFAYEAKSGGKLSKKRARISQLIDLLSPISQQLTFECIASFLFSKKLRAKSIVHLPQKPLELPDMPFDRIQGMHLVKLDGSETKYDVFLEAPTQGVILENVIFKYSSKIDNDLANNILVEALKISDKFIVKE